MTETTTYREISDFVCDRLLDGDRSRLGEPDEPLIGPVIDSVGLLELVDFLQSRFGIEVDDDEITEDNFQTLARVTAFTESKQAGD